MKRLLTTLCIILSCTLASAQFNTAGNDPFKVRWMELSSENFRVVYPEGMDSLARVYARRLETARIMNSWSSGLLVGQSCSSKMPVVLHAYNSFPNASVAWAPKRMDMFTVPEAYGPTPMPWEKELAIHEGRHAAQMQFGSIKVFRPLHFLTGELAAGALAGIFPGPMLLEGDAVVAETALSASGRGRQSTFLGYMMPAFDCDDYRDYWQWVYGGQKDYAPDYYRAGYMLVAGARVFFNDPFFTREYFGRVVTRPRLFNLQKTVKDASGRDFDTSFRIIQSGFKQIWEEEARERGPFMPDRMVSAPQELHTDYDNGTFTKDGTRIIALESGLDKAMSLVSIGLDGSRRRIRSFAEGTSSLYYDPNMDRIYWTEPVRDIRWTLASDSRIRYVSMEDPRFIKDLTEHGKYFCSVPSDDGRLIAAAEYPPLGGTRISILRSSDGAELRHYAAPDSLQVTEPVWLGERLFTAAVSENGIGLYEIDRAKGTYKKLLGPCPFELQNLGTFRDMVSFICDRTGVMETHAFNPDTGECFQVTSTRYGISGSFTDDAADTLYYSAVASSADPSTYKAGQMLYATAVKDLPIKKVRFDDYRPFPVAETLSRQERDISGTAWDEAERLASDTPVSDPVPFPKLQKPNFHSWAPFYFSYDNITEASGDEFYHSAALGATVFFQNLLGTGYGYAGHSIHRDPDDNSRWRNAFHLNYTYTGLPPVFEFSADLNDRQSMTMQRLLVKNELKDGKPVGDHSVTAGSLTGKPLLDAALRVYLPLNFSSGGWSKGIIPQVRLGFSNNRFLGDVLAVEPEYDDDGNRNGYRPIETIAYGKESFAGRMTASVRAYTVQATPPSCIFPRYGAGFDMGYRFRPGSSSSYTPCTYAYVYSYFPGLRQTHGMKVTALVQRQKHSGEWCYGDNSAAVVPRGFSETTLDGALKYFTGRQWKLSVDYAMPFAVPGSLSSKLSPAFYLKRIEVVPFADVTRAVTRDDVHPWEMTGNEPSSIWLGSVGADIELRLSNFLWLPSEAGIGLRICLNSSKGIPETMRSQYPVKDGFYCGFLFDLDI